MVIVTAVADSRLGPECGLHISFTRLATKPRRQLAIIRPSTTLTLTIVCVGCSIRAEWAFPLPPRSAAFFGTWLQHAHTHALATLIPGAVYGAHLCTPRRWPLSCDNTPLVTRPGSFIRPSLCSYYRWRSVLPAAQERQFAVDSLFKRRRCFGPCLLRGVASDKRAVVAVKGQIAAATDFGEITGLCLRRREGTRCV